MPEYYEIEFSADIQSKKNVYSQGKTGRRFKPQKVRDAEAICMAQIPPECIGLKLKHPAVETWMYWPKRSWAQDYDGAYTTVLDYLVRGSVLAQDDLRNFNGPKLHHPAVEAERKRFVIRLYPSGKIPGLLV